MKMTMEMEMATTGYGATATRSSIVVRLSGEKGRDDDVDDNKGSLGTGGFDWVFLLFFPLPLLPVPFEGSEGEGSVDGGPGLTLTLTLISILPACFWSFQI